MALTYPYSVDFLADCLIGDEIKLDLRRQDEMSGSGDGRYWSAELSRPLWTVSIALYSKSAAQARAVNAKVFALDGTRRQMQWANPYYRPAAGPDGLGSVSLSTVAADRGRVSLAGLPGRREVAAGDHLSIEYGAGRLYFGVFAESRIATAAGAISNIEVRPYLPLGISTGSVVELEKPVMNTIIPPGGFTPFAIYKDRWGSNASITLLQKP